MRYVDWQRRFWEEVERQRTAPFVWGERDCVLAAALVADAISDLEYERRAREAFNWKNAKEAAALLVTANLEALVETVMGPMLPWPSLGMGDMLLVIDDKQRQSLAIHDGAQVIGPAQGTDLGWQVIPYRYVQGGWHVT